MVGQVSNDMASPIVIPIVPAGGSGATVTVQPMESNPERASGESCSRLDRQSQSCGGYCLREQTGSGSPRILEYDFAVECEPSLLNQGRTHYCSRALRSNFRHKEIAYDQDIELYPSSSQS